MVERDEGGKFLPGTVANPGGRPKIPEVVRSRIQGLTVRAVEQIAGLLDSEDERIRLEAAKVILDRAYGRPAQSTELKIESADVFAMHLAGLLERAAARRAMQMEGGGAVLVGEGQAGAVS
ncbi:MAG: hypothetical protein AB7O44_32460 [Hyphomicrobiaceae bacterium]